MIDDFEHSTLTLPLTDGRGGGWYTYDDGSGGIIEFGLSADASSKAGQDAGHAPDSSVLQVTMDGYTVWGAGFGVTIGPSPSLNEHCSYDASVYSGIAFRARGSGRMRVQLQTVSNTPVASGGTCEREGDNCFDLPGVWVDLTDGWQTYVYPFCTFTPEGWGGPAAPLDPSELTNVQFRVGTGQHFELSLDDLAFLRADQLQQPTQGCGPLCPLDAAPKGATIDPTNATVTLSGGLSLHTFEQQTTDCGPLTRRYLSYVPATLEPASSAPVMMLLDGTGTSAEMMRDNTRGRFEVLADRDGFVVVYANAAPDSSSSTDPMFPNTGSWRDAYADDGQVDDVDYLERVLSDLQLRNVIQGDNPVYLAGESNGGGMVLKAARERPNRFAGIAPFMFYDGDVPPPVPDLTGSSLRRVLFAYSERDPGVPDGYPKVQALFPPLWAKALGLPDSAIDSPKVTQLADLVHEGDDYTGDSPIPLATRDSQVTQYDMAATGVSTQVRVLVFDHAGHFWPNPRADIYPQILDHWGFRNQDIDAADSVWDFFAP